MATEPNSADEASKLYNQLMEKENEILSTDKALWEKSIYGFKQRHSND